MDEQLDVHAFTVWIEGVRHHLADRNLAEVNRRADIQRPQILGDQGETLARFAIGDRRRVLQALEVLRPAIGLADVGADVIAGQQRIDTRDAAGPDTWPHHPELRIFAGKAFRLLGQFDGGVDAFLVVAQLHVRDMADHHVAVLDLGLVGGQPATGLEVHHDGGAFLQNAVDHQRNPHQHRDNRHDPDQRKAETATCLDRRLPGSLWLVSGLRLHP
ncbi:hypothetical protein D3C84_667020 [compost metagenome]